MKILLLDIETSPNTAFCWGLWDQNIGLSQLIESSEVLCFSAKWYGSPEIIFSSVQKTSTKKMLKHAHELLNAADAVVHYNGERFDIPCLNKEFFLHGMPPPAPYKQIDLLKTVRSQFRFPSNKLDYVCQRLGLGKKEETNFKLWVDCMHKDPEAWKKMESYNKQDTLLLEQLYVKLLPWIRNHPNQGLYNGEDSLLCPHCGGKNLQRRGYAYNVSVKYQRYVCTDCHTWFRGTKSLGPKPGDKYVHL